jgi:pimeloyl-ACP methyl ester carboxylesterase
MSEVDLSCVIAPTLIIVGESDIITQEHSKKMASLLKDGEFVVINKGGHATPVSHTREINALINSFIVAQPLPVEC